MGEPARGIRRLAYRLRTEGLPWIGRRLAHEWRQPSTGFGQWLFGKRAELTAYLWHRNGSGAGAVMPPDTLVAIMDLAIAPITYDVIWLIVGAEIERRRLGLAAVHFVAAPGPNDGVKVEPDAYDAIIDADNRRWRMLNIVQAAFGLLPSGRGVTLAASREHAAALCRGAAAVFPPHWTPGQPHFVAMPDVLGWIRAGADFRVLTAPAPARVRIDRWRDRIAGGRRLVTVTLRTYDFHPVRNSNLDAWAQFARSLDPQSWCVVFVADTDRTFDPPPAMLADQIFVPEASWNVGLRMALYEAAFVNLGINTGPMLLPFFSPTARGVMFGLVNEAAPQTSTEYMTSLGFRPGETPLGPESQGLWVWESDNAQAIIRSFRRMVELAGVRDD